MLRGEVDYDADLDEQSGFGILPYLELKESTF